MTITARDERDPAPSAAPLLAVAGLTKTYGGVHAVEGVSLEIRPGEVVGLVGDNGAGKSTLIKMISGVVRPDGGTIRMRGQEVRMTSPTDAQALGIETLHQHLGLVDVFNVPENIFLGRELKRRLFGVVPSLDHKAMRRRTEELLSRMGARLPDLKRPVRSMSGGQRQSVAISRLLLGKVSLIIMDEPMAALGVDESRKVIELISSLRAEGLALLVISHNLEHVFTIADRIAVMKNGQVVGVVDRRHVEHDDVVTMIVSGQPLKARADA